MFLLSEVLAGISQNQSCRGETLMKNPFENYDVKICSACGRELHLHVDRYRRVHAGRSEYYYHFPSCPPKETKPVGFAYG